MWEGERMQPPGGGALQGEVKSSSQPSREKLRKSIMLFSPGRPEGKGSGGNHGERFWRLGGFACIHRGEDSDRRKVPRKSQKRVRRGSDDHSQRGGRLEKSLSAGGNQKEGADDLLRKSPPAREKKLLLKNPSNGGKGSGKSRLEREGGKSSSKRKKGS